MEAELGCSSDGLVDGLLLDLGMSSMQAQLHHPAYGLCNGTPAPRIPTTFVTHMCAAAGHGSEGLQPCKGWTPGHAHGAGCTAQC